MGSCNRTPSQAKQLFNRLLRSSAVQEAILATPTGLLLLGDGKTLPTPTTSSSFSILDEWTNGDLTMYCPGCGNGWNVVRAPVRCARPYSTCAAKLQLLTKTGYAQRWLERLFQHVHLVLP